MFGIVQIKKNRECKLVEPSGVMWFGSREIAEQYYGWQKMSGQFPIGEWSTDDYGREMMVDILHYDKIMSPEFEIEGSGDGFLFNQENVYKNLKFEAHLEKYSLYENCNVHYSASPKTEKTLSEIHNFISSSIPVHKNYMLSIKEKIAKNITAVMPSHI